MGLNLILDNIPNSDLLEDPNAVIPKFHEFIPSVDFKPNENTLYYSLGLAKELEFQADPSHEDYDVRKLYAPCRWARIPSIPKYNVTSPEYVFWDTWFERIINGWIAPDGRFLTGYQVFGYNFMEVPLRDDKDPTIFDWTVPVFRDNDHEIFTIIWYNRGKVFPNGTFKNAKNHVEAKARGIGWTVINFIISLYEFVIDILKDDMGRAYPDEESLEIERLHYQDMWARLHPIFRTWQDDGDEKGTIMKPLTNQASGDFRVGVVDGNEKKLKSYKRKCSFDVVKTFQSAGLYKGSRMLSIEVIEAGKWKKGILKSLLEKSERCINTAAIQWGMFRIGGTSDKIYSNDTDYADIIVNHERYEATLHLSNATVCQIGFINNKTGVSNKIEALKACLQRRKDKEYDEERLQAEISESPLSLDELLKPKISYAYNKLRLIEQETYILDNRLNYNWIRGTIEETVDLHTREKTGGYSFVESSDGRWLMNIEAQPFTNIHHDYIDICAIDDRNVNFNEGAQRRKKDSKNALIIYRRAFSDGLFKSDIPALIYFSDEKDMFLEYQEFYKGIMLYDCKQVINEKNNIAFWTHMREKNEDHRLVHFDGSVGLKVTGGIKDEMTRLGHMYFDAGRYKKMTSLLIIDSWKIWGSTDNTDIGSAWHLVLYLIKDLDAKMLVPSMENISGLTIYNPTKNKSSVVRTGRIIQGNRNNGKTIKLGKRA